MPLTRRQFLASTAATLAASQVPGVAQGDTRPSASAAAASAAATQSKKLNVGMVGVGGRGFNHVTDLAAAADVANVVALCDVDAQSLVKAARVHTAAATFTDFRDLLQVKDLDAVLIATADHTHAVIIASALRAGKHVYSEKPLCHTIAELRAIVALADQTGLVTQTGIQMHASPNYHTVVEKIRDGVIGPVSEVNIWHNRVRRNFSTEFARPPASLNYDLWLGPCAQRPFRRAYHPYSWREYWDFGDGELGDQACHLLDPAFWSLDLTYPTHIETTGAEPPSEDLVCDHLIARYQFPARDNHPPLKLTWYDNPAKPPAWSDWKLNKKLASEGILFIGEKGMLCTNYTQHQLLPTEKFPEALDAASAKPLTRVTRNPSHLRNWLTASLRNDPSLASAPFRYGALLTETAILGTLAFRAGKPLDWDAQAMRFPNAPEADKFLRSTYRDGWTL